MFTQMGTSGNLPFVFLFTFFDGYLCVFEQFSWLRERPRESDWERDLERERPRESAYVHVCACMRACMHTCIHTYVHAYIHTCISPPMPFPFLTAFLLYPHELRDTVCAVCEPAYYFSFMLLNCHHARPTLHSFPLCFLLLCAHCERGRERDLERVTF